MPVKLIVMDMDGTLLDHDTTRIPRENAVVLKEAAAAGIHLAICSGRVPDDICMYALDAGLKDMHILALNGSCIMDRPLGNITESQKIPEETAARLWHIFQELPLVCGIFQDNLLCVNQGPVNPEHPAQGWGWNILREESRARLLYGPATMEEAIRGGTNKFVLLNRAHQCDLSALEHRLRDEFPDVEICSSWADNMEINLKGIHKGWAVEKLAAQLGIPMSAVMCIGDHNNDLDMLRCAGISVVMANGTPEAFDIANTVTLSNDRYGVAAAISTLALGKAVPGVRRLL